MNRDKASPKEKAEAIIFATEETNRLLGTLLGVTDSIMEDTCVVARTMLDLIAACESLWADRDASQQDQEACRRLYYAWRNLGECLHKAKGDIP